MRRMRLLFASFLIFGSSHAMAAGLCDFSKIGQQVATSAIAMALSCDNVEAISADVEGLVESFDLCSEDRIDITMMCPFITNFVINEAEKKIPGSWQCNPKVAKQVASQLINKGCMAIAAVLL